jgi:8-oxo-dGTP pyrophosphatase MutT (NUDIX family)
MTRAVCGFYFSRDKGRIVLIRKNRPDWQAGHLNGVGGKVEEGEFAIDAMRREFLEETGVDVEDWDPYCILVDEVHRFEVTYFRAFCPDLNLDRCKTMTDEEVHNFPVGAVFTLPVVHNLTWLVPMALDPNVSSTRSVWRDISTQEE